MMFDMGIKEVRLFFAQVWQKRFDPHLEPMEQMALKIILAHPEYHPILEQIERYLDIHWSPLQGEMNPFLHLSLHLSLQEQVSINQPIGIAEIHRHLCERYNGWLPAEHVMMDVLIEVIRTAQYAGGIFDNEAYIEQLQRLVKDGPINHS